MFGKETKHWQKKYKEGELDDEVICGETTALLDGSAERIGKRVLIISVVVLVLSLVSAYVMYGGG
jgi:hypothetical protein